jgi:Lrp/AsnC family leucine-responsive transcriptional regulator
MRAYENKGLLMDAIDRKLLALLRLDGRASYTELAEAVGLSGPSTADRVRRLCDSGVIRGFAADIEPTSLGADLGGFIAVTLVEPAARDAFLRAITDLPEVLECHHVTGDDDYLLKVRCAGTSGLEELVSERLKAVAGVARTRTVVILSTVFERSVAVEPSP